MSQFLRDLAIYGTFTVISRAVMIQVTERRSLALLVVRLGGKPKTALRYDDGTSGVQYAAIGATLVLTTGVGRFLSGEEFLRGITFVWTVIMLACSMRLWRNTHVHLQNMPAAPSQDTPPADAQPVNREIDVRKFALNLTGKMSLWLSFVFAAFLMTKGR